MRSLYSTPCEPRTKRFEIRVDLRILEVARRGRQIDQRRGHDLLHDLLDARIGVRREHAIRKRGLQVRQQCVADPLLRIVHHAVRERPEQIPPRDHFAEHGLVAAELVAAGGVERFRQEPRHEIELYGKARAALEAEAVEEPRARIEAENLVGVAVNQHVLPGDQHVVEHEDRVVLVEARRQRIVERRADLGCDLFVRGAAEKFHPGRVHRHDEHDREIGIAGRGRRVLTEEIVMRERRRGRHHLGARHDHAGVGLLLDRDIDVLDLVGRPPAIDRRVHDRVVHEQDVLLRALVPSLRVGGELAVIVGVGAERVHQRRLVVRRAAHPAIGHARPGGDRRLLRHQLLARARDPKIFMRVAARARVGRRGQHVLGLGVVQRVVEASQRARRIAERGMRGDVLDPLAVDIDLPPVAQALEIFLARERPLLPGDQVFRLLLHASLPGAAGFRSAHRKIILGVWRRVSSFCLGAASRSRKGC